MKDDPTIPASLTAEDIESIQDLGSARMLLRQLIAMMATLTALIESLRETIVELQETNALQRHETEQLKRALFGQKSERMVPASQEIKRTRRKVETEEQKAARLARTQETRRNNAEARLDAIAQEIVEHAIEQEELTCGCKLEELSALEPERRNELEYVPAHFICKVHTIERAVCRCGLFHAAKAPVRVVDGTHYGPGLYAHAVVSKCADSLPIYRQTKQFARAGMPISQSSLNDIFHRAAEVLRPIAERLLMIVAQQNLVHADETPLKVQAEKVCRKAFIWTFIANLGSALIVAYRFSARRSGETPVEVLGRTTGYLHVDGYSGYNAVTTPETRDRLGCWAHGRRKVFDAKNSAPEDADFILDKIRELYEVEYDAAEAQALGSAKHLAMRQSISRPIVEELYQWLDEEYPKRRPTSPIGKAMKYLINQRKYLERFLDDPQVSLDNNIAERHLRLIALGRKNFLFVGHDEAGENFAILQTVVATCIANDVNPQDYLTDVLARTQTHPQSELDDLLPHNWKPLVA